MYWLNLPILKDRDDHDRSKGLLLGNKHVILNIGEDGGLHKETYNTVSWKFKLITFDLKT